MTEGAINYKIIIEKHVTNGVGFDNHVDPGFKVGRESTLLVQLALGYKELDKSRNLPTYSGLRQDVSDLNSARGVMEERGLSGFYMRLQTPEDVLGALRDYQRHNSFQRGFHG